MLRVLTLFYLGAEQLHWSDRGFTAGALLRDTSAVSVEEDKTVAVSLLGSFCFHDTSHHFPC